MAWLYGYKSGLCIVLTLTLVLTISIGILAKQEFDEGDIVLRFGAISDLHFSGGAAKFEEAVVELYKNVGVEKLDVIVVAGDLTDSGSTSEISTLKNSLDRLEIQKKGTKFFFALGNHDTNFDLLPNNGIAFKKGLGDYAYEGASEDEIKNGNHRLVINGYHFIALNVKKYNGGVEIATEDKEWLKTKLQEAVVSDPKKPIFLVLHPLIYDTTYNSNLGPYWASEDIIPILKDYPQVITFGGHLHSPLNDERTIFQGDFTALNTGAVKYVALEDKVGGVPIMELDGGTVPRNNAYFSQGLFLEVDRNHNVRITRLDFFRSKEIKSPWIVPAPKEDKSHLQYYTYKARTENNKAPYFPEDAYVNIRRVVKKKLDVEFTAAIDDDLVYVYEIYLLDKETGLLEGQTHSITVSDFYMTPDPNEMASKLMRAFSTDAFQILSGEFDLDKEYVIKVVAIDSYGLKSQPIHSDPDFNE